MRLNYSLLFLFSLLLSGLISVSNAQQTNAKLKHLSKEADIIVTGKISKQKSNWNANKTRIYTDATLQVDEYLKGNNKGNSVTVTYPGGEVGSIGELYTHMPRFKTNEDVLVFLKKDKKSNSYKVYDGENGEVKILKDPKTGEKVTSSSVRINYLKDQIKSYLKK
jgi:uncharacterized phage-like protein YoqJ